MFHAEFLVDDKDVVRTLQFIATIRAFEVKVVPAVNVRKGKGRTVEAETSSGTASDRLAMQIRKQCSVGEQLDRQMIFEMIRSVGNSPSSALVAQLVKAKVLKKKGRGFYVVL